MVIHVNKKIIGIILLTALLVATGSVLVGAGEDSDCPGSSINVVGWETLFGKEGGDEGVFLCIIDITGEDSD